MEPEDQSSITMRGTIRVIRY